jgi:hypothetical protein
MENNFGKNTIPFFLHSIQSQYRLTGFAICSSPADEVDIFRPDHPFPQ